jgi:hypothetical protein
MVTVPDQNAGQMMKCPSCNEPFAVPALPQAPVPSRKEEGGWRKA